MDVSGLVVGLFLLTWGLLHLTGRVERWLTAMRVLPGKFSRSTRRYIHVYILVAGAGFCGLGLIALLAAV